MFSRSGYINNDSRRDQGSIAAVGAAWIEKDGNVLFADWFYKVPEDLLKAKVKEFAFAPEICHKNWEKLGLTSPMQPEEMPDYSFSDLMMKLYYRMKI